ASCSWAGRANSRTRRTGSSEITCRSLSSSCRRASDSSTASSTWEVTPRALSSALMRYSIASPIREVSVLAAAACLAITAIGQQVKVVLMCTGLRIHVGMTPRIHRYGLFQVRPLPVRHARGSHVERREPFLGAGQTAHIDTELLERLVECVDLRACGFDTRFADLREVARRYESGQQA